MLLAAEYSITDLGVLSNPSDAYDFSWGAAINSMGQVAGGASIKSGYQTVQRAFLWTPGTGMQNLGVLPDYGSSSYANDVNDSGQVVGSSSNGVSGGDRAFPWEVKR